jgi:hypothetical protein
VTWFKMDDAFHSHPKARRAGLQAIGLWSVSGSYCANYLTNGFVDVPFVKTWPSGIKLATKLVEAGLWLPTERDGQPGWQFHDWDKYQPTKEQVEIEREAARNRKAKSRESRRVSQPESHRDTPEVSRRDSRVIPGVRARNPDPTRPDQEISGHPESESPDSTEREPRSAPVTPIANRLVREIIPAEHPDAVKTELRIQASTLLKAGTPEDLVADALRLWLTKNLHPKTLPSLVSELINGRNRPAGQPVESTRVAPATRKVGIGLDLAKQFATPPEQPALEA